MAGRQWSEDELQKLEKWNGTCTCATMARRLGRSPEAVSKKMQRLGLLGFRQATDLLTSFQIQKTFGIQYRTLLYWSEKKGLRLEKKENHLIVRQKDFYDFLKAHPDDWDARKVVDDSIFMNREWFLEKRRQDRNRKKRGWTRDEVGHLIICYRKGIPVSQIAKEMGRTESSVKNKMHYMTSRGFRI